MTSDKFDLYMYYRPVIVHVSRAMLVYTVFIHAMRMHAYYYREITYWNKLLIVLVLMDPIYNQHHTCRQLVMHTLMFEYIHIL